MDSVNAGAKVAREPAGIKGAKFAARSLYGGIVNTVGASALQADHFVQTLVALGSSLPRRASSSKSPHPLTGLIAALRISHRFKDCFSESRDMTLRSWYLMHLEGETILSRLRRHRLGDELAPVTYDLAASATTGIFGKVQLYLRATPPCERHAPLLTPQQVGGRPACWLCR